MNQEHIFKIILAPYVTEKAQVAADKRHQIVFKVTADATKPEIKKAIEHLFKVEVESVQVVNCQGKKKRFGQRQGKRKDWKKAYVSLAEGHDINFVGAEA